MWIGKSRCARAHGTIVAPISQFFHVHVGSPSVASNRWASTFSIAHLVRNILIFIYYFSYACRVQHLILYHPPNIKYNIKLYTLYIVSLFFCFCDFIFFIFHFSFLFCFSSHCARAWIKRIKCNIPALNLMYKKCALGVVTVCARGDREWVASLIFFQDFYFLFSFGFLCLFSCTLCSTFIPLAYSLNEK